MTHDEIIADLRAEIGRRQDRIYELEAENAKLAATRPSERLRAWLERLAHLMADMPIDLLHFDERPVDWSQFCQAYTPDDPPPGT